MLLQINNKLELAGRARIKTMYFEYARDQSPSAPLSAIDAGKAMKKCVI
jgi:hypothetical protein